MQPKALFTLWELTKVLFVYTNEPNAGGSLFILVNKNTEIAL